MKLIWVKYWSAGLDKLKVNWKSITRLSEKNNNNNVKRSAVRFNSLWPSDSIWWHSSGSTLAQVMACCLTAPSHYLSQHIINRYVWHEAESNVTGIVQEITWWHELENYTSMIITTSPRGQWVNGCPYHILVPLWCHMTSRMLCTAPLQYHLANHPWWKTIAGNVYPEYVKCDDGILRHGNVN